MRTLNKNKSALWYVIPTGTTPKLDSNGFKTGENITTYSTPVKIMLNIFPSVGDIVEQIFGIDASYDMIAVSNEIELKKDCLLFLTEPISDYRNTYDFRVDSIKRSLNTFNYGLRSRT